MAAPAPVVRLDPAVLRQALGATLVLREGQVLGGRVAEVHGRHGILLLRGAPVVAELPEGLQRGQALRLAVAGAAEDGKVVLRLLADEAAPAPAQAPAAPPVAPWVALPGGGRLRVEPDEEPEGGGQGEGGEGRRSVRVRFEGVALGPVDVHLALDPAGRVQTTVHAAPAALAALRAAREELGSRDVRLQARRGGELDARA